MALKVWLPLTGDLHNQGLLNITGTNYNSSIATNGKLGSCYSFNGTNCRIEYIHDKTVWNNKEISIAMWYKYQEGNTTNTMVDIAADLCLSYTYTNNTIKFGYWRAWSNNGTRTGDSGIISQAFDAANWHHVVATFNHNINKIYVDGSLIETFDRSSKYNTNFTPLLGSAYNKITLGKSAGSNPYGSGYLNDVRIYDHCLSAAEVHEIAQGLVLHYKLDGVSEEKNTIIPNTNVYTYPTFSTSSAGGGWSHWGPSGHSGSYGQNTDKTYIYNKNNTYSHWVTENSGTGKYYLIYQSPAFEGGNRSLQAIIKEENSLPITDSICNPSWNARSGGVPNNKWTSIEPLEDGFYYCKCEGVSQDGSNDLIGINVMPGYKIYISECYLEDNTETCSPILTYSSNSIQDSSGYGHNGTIVGTLAISADAPRYNFSTNLINANSMINCGRGGMVTDSITVNLWIKTSSWANPISCTESGGWNFESAGDGIRFPIYISGVGYCYQTSTRARSELLDNQWHMLTGVYDRIGQEVRLYIDGVLESSAAVSAANDIKYHSSNVIWLGAEATSSNISASNGMAGLFSDLRIYCTPLLDNDIKMLYNIGMKIDNSSAIHTFEYNETSTKNKLTKSGTLQDNIIEQYLTLNDGSHWKLMLFHYVDNGRNLFTSSNATNCNELGLYSRLKDINNYTYDNKYEFYVIQDGKEFRWTQTSQPTASSCTGLTTVSGYTNPQRGLAKAGSTNTYLGYGSWWGACGCWTSYSTGGKTGIPGFGPASADGICTDYLILYTRIDNPKAQLENTTSYATNFIEM